jgi:DNA repair protein RadC
MVSRHFVPGGGMPGVRGSRDRPLARVEEGALFRIAFPGDGETMRRIARGEGDSDPDRSLRWEAVLELARRTLSASVPRPEPFRCAAEVFERYRYRFAPMPVEVFLAVLLDVKHRPVRDERVSVGILDGSLIHPREVFAAAVRERAAAVILLHNHPSGDPAPSPEDREVTLRLREAGSLLGIPVLDHVIIGDGAYFSFREEAGW